MAAICTQQVYQHVCSYACKLDHNQESDDEEKRALMKEENIHQLEEALKVRKEIFHTNLSLHIYIYVVQHCMCC